MRAVRVACSALRSAIKTWAHQALAAPPGGVDGASLLLQSLVVAVSPAEVRVAAAAKSRAAVTDGAGPATGNLNAGVQLLVTQYNTMAVKIVRASAAPLSTPVALAVLTRALDIIALPSRLRTSGTASRASVDHGECASPVASHVDAAHRCTTPQRLHRALAVTLNNFACVYNLAGDVPQAIKCLEYALSYDALGTQDGGVAPDHHVRDRVKTLVNLAALYQHVKRTADAERCVTQAEHLSDVML